MRRIDLPFQDLRPVAANMNLHNRDIRVLRRREGRRLELRHGLGRPHIGPYEAAPLAGGIGLDLHLLGETALRRLGRHLDHVAVHVHLPAMIEAAQPAFLIAAEGERHPAMRTIFVDHAKPALAVAKHHEILAEQSDLQRRAIRLGHLLDQAGRHPVAAHDLTHRRVALDAAQQVVFLCGHHRLASQACLRGPRTGLGPGENISPLSFYPIVIPVYLSRRSEAAIVRCTRICDQEARFNQDSSSQQVIRP
jgi:hypothetical protein